MQIPCPANLWGHYRPQALRSELQQKRILQNTGGMKNTSQGRHRLFNLREQMLDLIELGYIRLELQNLRADTPQISKGRVRALGLSSASNQCEVFRALRDQPLCHL